MTDHRLVGPSLLYVRWHCRRCGFRDGIARTTTPALESNGTMGFLLEALRQKLIAVHLADRGCYATREDFDVAPYVPAGQTLLGKV